VSGAAHGEPVVAEVPTALHDAAPEIKVVALVAFALSVAFVPHGAWWPFAVDALIVAVFAAWGRVPVRSLLVRLVVEIPFLAFVVLLPFVAGAEGLALAGAIVCKATLVVLATGILSATTPAPEIILGLERLRVPAAFTAIGALAVRYLMVVLDELRRVNTARQARGDDARWFWQVRAVAQSTGTLAIRCIDRGERVHSAMLARGYDGRLPAVALGAAEASPRVLAATLAGVAVVPALVATVLTRGGIA
jgi:cobalt/nickel transport system permease protein